MSEVTASDGQGRGPRLQVGLGLALVASGAGLLGAGAPGWWVGAGLVAAGLTQLGPLVRSARGWLQGPRRELLVELVCLGLIVTVATVMVGDALGARPVSGDHTVHFAKYLEAKALLADTGRPLGWSHALYAGHPLGYQYPFLPDLWLSLFEHALGLSSESAYGVGVWAFWVTLGLGVYAFGRRAFDRPVGVIAAIAYLTTAGLPHAGGWEYILRWGVWPQWLALAFLLFACARLERVLTQGRPRVIAGAALFLGLALLGHQASILGLMLTLAALVLAWWWGPRPATTGRRAAWRVLLVVVLAGLVAAAFLMPFWSTRALTDERGNFWLTGFEVGEALVTRASIVGELPVIALAALAGAGLALTRRAGFLPVFATFFTLLAFAGSHSSLLGELDLLEQSDPFRHVIWYRVVELGKPFYFVLAASALVAFGRVLAARPRVLHPLMRGVFAFALGLTLAPLAGGAVVAWWVGGAGRDAAVLYERPYQADRAALVDFVRRSFPAVGADGAGFFRFANLSAAADRHLSDLGPELGRPLYKPGFTPVSNYLYKVRSQSSAALNAINVGYAIADRTLPPMDWEPVRTFGQLGLYRFKRADLRLWRVLGAGGAEVGNAGVMPVRVIGFARERVVVEVGELPPSAPVGALLRLSISSFPRWQATRDGVEVPIQTVALPDHPGTGFIAVPLAAGRWVFEFSPSTLDRVALALTPLGLLLVLLLALADTRWLARRALGAWGTRCVDGAWLERLPSLPPQVPRIVALALMAGLAILVLALGARTPPRELPPAVAATREVEAVLWDAHEALDDATAMLGARVCRRGLDGFLCADADPAHEIASTPAVFGEFELATCITLEPRRGEPASLTFPAVPPGELNVAFGVRSRHETLPPRPTTFRVLVDGVELHEATLRVRPQLERKLLLLDAPRPVTLRIEVERPDDEPRHACFAAQIVRTRPAPPGSPVSAPR